MLAVILASAALVVSVLALVVALLVLMLRDRHTRRIDAIDQRLAPMERIAPKALTAERLMATIRHAPRVH